MGYIEDNLMPDEKIYFRANVHPVIMLPSMLTLLLVLSYAVFATYGITRAPHQTTPATQIANGFFLCVTSMLILTLLLKSLGSLVIFLTTEFVVTNRRVLAKYGFIRRQTVEILLSKIESVTVYQGIMGRLLNYGTVTITGTGGTRGKMRGIASPTEVRRKINAMIAYATGQGRASSQ